VDLQPTREMGTTRDVASAVLFLGSDDAAFVTGQVVMVDGGRSVGLLPI
jgi:NAD(P)-dependent dehydrogenase (short-subunit alcohol dehydrogenase family)